MLPVGRGPGRPAPSFYKFLTERPFDYQFRCLSVEGRVVQVNFVYYVVGQPSEYQFRCLSVEGRVVQVLVWFTSMYRGGLLIRHSVACL